MTATTATPSTSQTPSGPASPPAPRRTAPGISSPLALGRQLLSIRANPLAALDASTARFGHVFRLSAPGSADHLFLNDPALAKAVLLTNQHGALGHDVRIGVRAGAGHLRRRAVGQRERLRPHRGGTELVDGQHPAGRPHRGPPGRIVQRRVLEPSDGATGQHGRAEEPKRRRTHGTMTPPSAAS